MARLPRIVVPGQALHIVQRGNNRHPTFFSNMDYQFYLDSLAVSAECYGCAIHAYVLMTNHVHLLLTPEAKESPSRCLQALGRKYVRYINGTYQRTGTLWEGRFKSALIDSDNYLLTCYRYIELNPVRANMVKLPGNYRWSSYHANALGSTNEFITPHMKYLELGHNMEERLQAYRGLFTHHIDKEGLQIIRKGTESDTVIGNDVFKEHIAKMLARRVVKYDHGGDRKSPAFQNK
jgi:putative transposase